MVHKSEEELVLQSWYRLLHYAILNSWTGLVIFFSTYLILVAMPLLTFIVQYITFIVLLILLSCYPYDAILILTLGYPLYTNWYIS